jgi:hypothetical protein
VIIIFLFTVYKVWLDSWSGVLLCSYFRLFGDIGVGDCAGAKALHLPMDTVSSLEASVMATLLFHHERQGKP